MKKDVFSQRIEKIRDMMRENEVDAFIIAKPEELSGVNIQYLSGFTGSHCYIVIRKDRAVFLTDSRYTKQAQQEVRGMEVLVLSNKQALPEAISMALSGAKRAGLEEAGVFWQVPLAIQKNLEKCELVPLSPILRSVRAIKNKDEIKKIKKSIRATENALRFAYRFIKPGVSEKDVAQAFERALPKGVKLAFDSIIASGKRSLMPHGIASSKKIERGDVVQFDVGCVIDGYVSDISRVVVCGKATPEQKKMWSALTKSIREALRFYRPGVDSSEAAAKANEILEFLGYQMVPHSLGHGIGLEVHELPYAGLERGKQMFEAGNVVSIEPGVYEEKYGFGMRIERDVLITSKGPEILDTMSTELSEF